MNKIRKGREAKLPTGFTLIELLVILFVLGLLAMIAVPNYFEMRERGRQAMVVENMKIVQLAVEAYATDFNGFYPTGPETSPYGFAYYFPGGDEEMQVYAGTYPKNPYTGRHMIGTDFNAFPVGRKPGDNRNEAIGGPNDLWMCPGHIRYGCVYPPPEYAVVGGDAEYKSIRIANRIIVLHN